MPLKATIRRELAVWAMLTLGGVGLFNCGPDRSTLDKGATAVPTRPIEAVLVDHTRELMALPGVTGVYQGQLDDGSACIGVLVREATPEITAKIPPQLEGYPVKIEASGEIRPMSK